MTQVLTAKSGPAPSWLRCRTLQPPGSRLRPVAPAARISAGSEPHEHCLEARIVFDRLLTALAAEARLLHAAERRDHVERQCVVYPDRPSPQALDQCVGPRNILGVDGGGEAVDRVVSLTDGVVHVVERDDRQDRSEDLLLG